MYKAVRETLITATLKLHSQVDMSNPEVSLKQITEFINVPVEKMVENKELSSARELYQKVKIYLLQAILNLK